MRAISSELCEDWGNGEETGAQTRCPAQPCSVNLDSRQEIHANAGGNRRHHLLCFSPLRCSPSRTQLPFYSEILVRGSNTKVRLRLKLKEKKEAMKSGNIEGERL
jgi:hypothetical protein